MSLDAHVQPEHEIVRRPGFVGDGDEHHDGRPRHQGAHDRCRSAWTGGGPRRFAPGARQQEQEQEEAGPENVRGDGGPRPSALGPSSSDVSRAVTGAGRGELVTDSWPRGNVGPPETGRRSGHVDARRGPRRGRCRRGRVASSQLAGRYVRDNTGGQGSGQRCGRYCSSKGSTAVIDVRRGRSAQRVFAHPDRITLKP